MAVGTGRGAVEQPRIISAILVLAIGGAVVLLANALGSLTGVDATRASLLAGGAQRSAVEGAITEAYTSLIGVTAIYAAIIVALVLLMRSGRYWARTALIAASIVSLLPMLILGAASVFGVVMLGAADVLLFNRGARDWLMQARDRRARRRM